MVSGGSSKQSAASYGTSYSGPTQWQKALWAKITPWLKKTMFQPAPTYEGDMYVPTTPEEKTYMASVAGLKSGALRNVFEGKVPYDISPEYAERFYTESVEKPALKTYREEVLPSIQASAAGPGYYGSARMLAETKAGTDLASELASKRAEAMYGEEMYRRQAQERAVERQLGVTTYGLGEEAKVGQLSRAIKEEEVLSNLQRYLMGEEVGGTFNLAYSPYMQMVMALLGYTGESMSTQAARSRGSSWNFGLFS